MQTTSEFWKKLKHLGIKTLGHCKLWRWVWNECFGFESTGAWYDGMVHKIVLLIIIIISVLKFCQTWNSSGAPEHYPGFSMAAITAL